MAFPYNPRILGGEPTLHPHLCEIFESVRQFWPDTHISISTNGLAINKHPRLPELLSQPNSSIHLSIQSYEEKYTQKITQTIETLEKWRRDFGVHVTYGDAREGFVRFYKGVGKYMKPFDDGKVKESWRACTCNHCLNIVNNRLWKCPPIAGLPFVAKLFDLGQLPEWRPYLAYKSLGLESSDKELEEFLGRGPEAICGMCPAKPELYAKDVFNQNFDLPNQERVEWKSSSEKADLPVLPKEIYAADGYNWKR